MALTERHALAHQVIGQVGGQHTVVQGGGHAAGVHLQSADDPRSDGQFHLERVNHVKDGLLVLLQVLVVGRGQPLERRQQPHQVAHHPPALAAHQFQRVGILFLRHEARAGGVGVGYLHKAKLAAGPQDEILRQATEVHLHQRGPGQELDDVIPVAHRVYAVLAHTVKAQFGGQRPAVYVERIAGQRPRPQWADLRAPGHAGQPLAAALEFPEEGHQPVAKEQRLRLLQVRVARHDHVQVNLGLLNDGRLQPDQRLTQGNHLVQQVETQVGGHLVVAGATRVEFSRHRPYQLGQPPLDCGVDVLVAGLDLQGAGVEFSMHLFQPGDELVALIGGEQPRPRQRAGVGDAAPHVGRVHPPVEADGVTEAPHQPISFLRKTPPPKSHSLLLHSLTR